MSYPLMGLRRCRHLLTAPILPQPYHNRLLVLSSTVPCIGNVPSNYFFLYARKGNVCERPILMPEHYTSTVFGNVNIAAKAMLHQTHFINIIRTIPV